MWLPSRLRTNWFGMGMTDANHMFTEGPRVPCCRSGDIFEAFHRPHTFPRTRAHVLTPLIPTAALFVLAPLTLVSGASPRPLSKTLMGEVADLTSLLEHEATCKSDSERRSRQHPPTGSKNDNGGGDKNDTGDGTACNGGPIPSSELRRYGKKLEEAVRSQEHAADVVERLSLPRRRPQGDFSSGGPAVDERKGGGRKGPGAAALVITHGPRRYGKAGNGRPSRDDSVQPAAWCPNDLPGPGPVGLTSLNHRGPERRRKGSRRRASSVGSSCRSSGEGGSGAEGNPSISGVEVEVAGEEGGGGREGRCQGEPRGQGRALLAVKLRGTVRVSREEAALDDDRFWS